MPETNIRWLDHEEGLVGKDHPAVNDTLNRALRDVFTASGVNPDSPFAGFATAAAALANASAIAQEEVARSDADSAEATTRAAADTANAQAIVAEAIARAAAIATRAAAIEGVHFAPADINRPAEDDGRFTYNDARRRLERFNQVTSAWERKLIDPAKYLQDYEAAYNLVDDFGADPTGATDSDVAMAAFVAAHEARSGGTKLIVPDGTYTFATSNSIHRGNLTIEFHGNPTFQANGAGVYLLKFLGDESDEFDISGYMSNIRIIGHGRFYDPDPLHHVTEFEESHGIFASHCRHVFVEGCTFEGMGDESIDTGASTEVLILHNRFIGATAASNGGGAIGVNNARNVTVMENAFENIGMGNCVRVEVGAAPDDVIGRIRVVGNRIRGYTATALDGTVTPDGTTVLQGTGTALDTTHHAGQGLLVNGDLYRIESIDEGLQQFTMDRVVPLSAAVPCALVTGKAAIIVSAGNNADIDAIEISGNIIEDHPAIGIHIVNSSTVAVGAALTGTVATDGTMVVTGTSTTFLDDFDVGDHCQINAIEYTVVGITSNTSMIVNAFVPAGSGYSIYRYTTKRIKRVKVIGNTVLGGGWLAQQYPSSRGAITISTRADHCNVALNAVRGWGWRLDGYTPVQGRYGIMVVDCNVIGNTVTHIPDCGFYAADGTKGSVLEGNTAESCGLVLGSGARAGFRLGANSQAHANFAAYCGYGLNANESGDASNAHITGNTFQYCTIAGMRLNGRAVARGNFEVNCQLAITLSGESPTVIDCPATGTVSSPAIVNTSNFRTLTGTVAITNGSPTVTGTGTAFEHEIEDGQTLRINGTDYTVSTVNSNTSITLTGNAGESVSGQTATNQSARSAKLRCTTGDWVTVARIVHRMTGATQNVNHRLPSNVALRKKHVKLTWLEAPLNGSTLIVPYVNSVSSTQVGIGCSSTPGSSPGILIAIDIDASTN